MRKRRLDKFWSVLTAVIFAAQTLAPGVALAQQGMYLPPVGVMVTPSAGFVPAVIRGLRVNADNPLRFDFIIDTGNTHFDDMQMEIESAKLIRYFLAALTVPEDELWVNLSPYEADRIIPSKFGLTEMGRDLLAQDYMLKQLTASLFNPREDLGATFWARVRTQAQERFGSAEIDADTFNKVWVLPERAVVYESGDVAYVVESRLKVMLEADYFALDEYSRQRGPGQWTPEQEIRDVNDLSSQVIREVIVPAIEKEVNEGEHFAPLRQVYHSLILAAWFKRNLRASLVGKVYVEQNKVKGVDLADEGDAEAIYQQYLQAFKVGVYDYVEDEYDPVNQQIIPRKYFSGGADLAMTVELQTQKVNPGVLSRMAEGKKVGDLAMVSTDFQSMPVASRTEAADPAMVAGLKTLIRNVFMIWALASPAAGIADDAIEQYAEMFLNEQINFVIGLPGEDAADQMGADSEFARFWDAVNSKIQEELQKQGALSQDEARQLIEEAINVWIRENRNSEEAETHSNPDLRGLFEDDFTRYVIALSNEYPSVEKIGRDLVVQSQKIDKPLADMMLKLVEFGPKIARSSREELRDMLMAWNRFNLNYLIERGLYVSLEISGPIDHQFYVPVVYEVKGTETKTAAGKSVLVVYGHKIGNLNTVGDLGHSTEVTPIVFVDVDQTTEQATSILNTTLRGEHYPLHPLSSAFSPGIDRLVNILYGSMNRSEITDDFKRLILAHELTHQVQDVRYQGDDYFGVPKHIYEDPVNDSKRDVLDKEALALLGSLMRVEDSRKILIEMMPHVLGRSGDVYYYVNKWLLVKLTELLLNKSMNPDDANDVIGALSDLANAGSNELKNTAKRIVKDGWGEETVRAIESIDPAMVTADLTLPAVWNLYTELQRLEAAWKDALMINEDVNSETIDRILARVFFIRQQFRRNQKINVKIIEESDTEAGDADGIKISKEIGFEGENLYDTLLRAKLGVRTEESAVFLENHSGIIQAPLVIVSRFSLGPGVKLYESPSSQVQRLLDERRSGEKNTIGVFRYDSTNDFFPIVNGTDIFSRVRRSESPVQEEIQPQVNRIIAELTGNSPAYWLIDERGERTLVVRNAQFMSDNIQWVSLSDVLPRAVLATLPIPLSSNNGVPVINRESFRSSTGFSDGEATEVGEQNPDEAMMTEEVKPNDVGGIDLNPNRLDIERRGSGMDPDFDPADPAMLEMMNIEGFVPVIIQIAPANMPMLLGMADIGEPSTPLDVRTRSPAISRL